MTTQPLGDLCTCHMSAMAVGVPSIGRTVNEVRSLFGPAPKVWMGVLNPSTVRVKISRSIIRAAVSNVSAKLTCQ